MQNASIVVRALWDDDVSVWVATSTDIDGLAVEADTMENLKIKVLDAIVDLWELNGETSTLPEIPIHIVAEQVTRLPNPAL